MLRDWWLWFLVIAILFGLGVAFNILGYILMGVLILCDIGAVIAAVAGFIGGDLKTGFEYAIIAAGMIWFTSWFF